MRRSAVTLLLASAVACGARSELDTPADQGSGTLPSPDAGPDATLPPSAGDGGSSGPSDAGHDAGGGAEHDATLDAATDAPPDDAGTDAPILPARCAVTTVTELASSSSAADEIALDDTFAYFRDTSGIYRVPKGGGTTTQILSWSDGDWPFLTAFVVDDAGVTWEAIDFGNATTTINRVPKAGGATTTLASLTGEYFGVSPMIGGGYYSWASGAMPLSELVAVSTSGALTVVSTGLPPYTNYAAQDDGALWLSGEDGLYRSDGSAFPAFVSTPGLFVGYPQFDETNVFFFVNSAAGETISSVPLVGGDAGALASGSESAFGLFALDDLHLFVTNRFQNTVTRMNKDGTGAEVIGSGVAGQQALGIAVDAACVYWVSSGAPSHVYVAPKGGPDGGD